MALVLAMPSAELHLLALIERGRRVIDLAVRSGAYRNLGEVLDQASRRLDA
jgi:hypothetical protein